MTAKAEARKTTRGKQGRLDAPFPEPISEHTASGVAVQEHATYPFGKMEPLKPPASLLSKLGSIIVHMEEATAQGGHAFDVQAMRGLLQDPEVVEWMAAMRKLALLPVRRDQR